MFDVNIKIINELNHFLDICVSDPEIMDVCRIHSYDFVRNRKLSFKNLVLFILKLCKKTLSVELDNFFENELKEESSCSVSAFSQQRNKLDCLFFQIWNLVLCQSFYHHGIEETKRWRGYRVIAGDGTTISLLNTEALSKHFGGQRNQQAAFTGARSFLHYDVLNKLFTHAHLAPYRTAELNMAYGAISKLGYDTLTIYDRNFCNYKMVALHCWAEHERKFVIRAKENQKFITSFINSGKASDVVTMPVTESAIAGLKKCGFIITPMTILKVRLVRVELNNGSIEVLMTNLWPEDGYEDELFKDLYFMRWNIETGISVLKNILKVESFSGLTVQSVTQDYHATIFTANLAALIIGQANEAHVVQKQSKMGRPITKNWPTQVNVNKGTARIQQKLISLFISRDPTKILEALSIHLRKHMLPIRKGRTSPRKRKNKQSFCKHRTFTNYKAAA